MYNIITNNHKKSYGYAEFNSYTVTIYPTWKGIYSMLLHERQEKILEMLQKDSNIKVSTMAKELYSSEATIRRDLLALQEKGFLKKVYGGVILKEVAPDSKIPFNIREKEDRIIKERMAQRAAEFVHSGDVVALDGSTSVFYMARHLAKLKDIIVVTNGAKTAIELAQRGIHTICTGGDMLLQSYTYVGSHAEQMIRRMNFDIFFFSCRGLSADGKLTDRSIEENNMRSIFMEQSRKSILLCNSAKFDKKYLYTLCDADDVDEIISDSDFTPHREENE